MMVTKSAKQVQQALREYLAGKSEKDLNLSDIRIIGAALKNKKIAKDQNIQQKKSETIKNSYKDPLYKELRHNIVKEAAKTEKYKTNHANGMIKRVENGWVEKNNEAAQKRCKPIQTPYGLFPSKRDAVKEMTALGIKNAGGKLSSWIITKPTEYYYIKK